MPDPLPPMVVCPNCDGAVFVELPEGAPRHQGQRRWLMRTPSGRMFYVTESADGKLKLTPFAGETP